MSMLNIRLDLRTTLDTVKPAIHFVLFNAIKNNVRITNLNIT